MWHNRFGLFCCDFYLSFLKDSDDGVLHLELQQNQYEMGPHGTGFLFSLQPGFIQELEIKLNCFVAALPHMLLQLVYKHIIVLITLYTLFSVSSSAVRFPARMLLTGTLDFQSRF